MPKLKVINKLHRIRHTDHNIVDQNPIAYSIPQLLITSHEMFKKYFKTYLIFGGSESIRAVIRSVLFIDNVVVVLYDPELLSWYSCSVTTAVGTSFLIISNFLLAEFLALVGLTCTAEI